MSAMPFWSAVTDQASMRAAAPWKKAVMFAAGETSTAICSVAAAYAAMATGVPGGRVLFLATVAWNAVRHHRRRAHTQRGLRQGAAPTHDTSGNRRCPLSHHRPGQNPCPPMLKPGRQEDP